jgi:co-chaperonin GroES (HSP10)
MRAADNRVIAIPITEETTESGIILKEAKQSTTGRAIVKIAGTGTTVYCNEEILYYKHKAVEFEAGDEALISVHNEDILAVL